MIARRKVKNVRSKRPYNLIFNNLSVILKKVKLMREYNIGTFFNYN